MLEKSLEKHHADRGVHTMKQEMLKSLKQWYACVESNEILTFSTALDPRFKDKCFSQVGTAEKVRCSLKHKVAELKSRETEQPPSESEVSIEGLHLSNRRQHYYSAFQIYSKKLER